MSRRLVAGLLLGGLLLESCMPAAHRKAEKLEGRYTTGLPGPGWAQVPPGGADIAWYNAGLRAMIYTDSNCGPRFEESRVEDLATELVSGLRDVKLEREETLTVAGREGILRVQSGKLDGVPVKLGLGVVNLDACNQDFTFIAPPESFDAGWAAYQEVIAGFEWGKR